MTMPEPLTSRRISASACLIGGMLLGMCWLASGACSGGRASSCGNDGYRERRLAMVADQLRTRDITDRNVLRAMERVPRHLFVPAQVRAYAYSDCALPISHGQTISQPYVVALMTQLAGVRRGTRVLEVGTGSGYQAAVLAEMGAEVWSVEIICALAAQARERLRSLGYNKVRVKCGDGYRGWPGAGPFQAILVTAASVRVPPPLLEQLAPGGRLVVPLGTEFQNLVLIEKTEDGRLRRYEMHPVRFVPMTGEALEPGGK